MISDIGFWDDKEENMKDQEVIQGTPFCECGCLMVCIDGVELKCPICSSKKEGGE